MRSVTFVLGEDCLHEDGALGPLGQVGRAMPVESFRARRVHLRGYLRRICLLNLQLGDFPFLPLFFYAFFQTRQLLLMPSMPGRRNY